MNAIYREPDEIQQKMIPSPGDGANEWRCESCIYYPPSSFGGKPCSYCWEGGPYLEQYSPCDGAEGGEG